MCLVISLWGWIHFLLFECFATLTLVWYICYFSYIEYLGLHPHTKILVLRKNYLKLSLRFFHFDLCCQLSLLCFYYKQTFKSDLCFPYALNQKMCYFSFMSQSYETSDEIIGADSNFCRLLVCRYCRNPPNMSFCKV